MSRQATNPYRMLPSVEETLGRPEVALLCERVPRAVVVRFVQEILDGWRAQIQAGELDEDGVRERLALDELLVGLVTRVRAEEGAGLVPVVNATGVVLHTGLGRAPLHPEAAAAMAEAARRYGTLEVDRFSGQRNRRDDRLSELLCRLTGAEAAIAVNNNAGAVLLALNTFAAGRGTVVSRGELVEIGGSFRMPDVMVRAGTRLVEVGTTNRTRIADFRAAARADDVGLLLKVHRSNFHQLGFTEEVEAAELAELGGELGIRTVYDLGSGLLDLPGAPLHALQGEPRVGDAVHSGVDLVLFSGDKLLGGPQAGLIVGNATAVAAMRANPMYRALRLDKVAIAGLERTLELFLDGRGHEVPAWAMLAADEERLGRDARAIASALEASGWTVRVAADVSQPGSGSAPGTEIPTTVVRVRSAELGTGELAARLRAGEPPVFGRIQDDELVLDPRTLLEGDLERLLTAFAALGGRDAQRP